MEKELNDFKISIAKTQAKSLLGAKQKQGQSEIIVAEFEPGISPDALREIAIDLRTKLANGVVILASRGAERANLVAAVSSGAKEQGLKAGNLIRIGSQILGGGGGGKDDFAQGGGTDQAQIGAALEQIKNEIEKSLS